ncbi:Ldh family oxidoreductase [Exilibacterium tricleocarpae]|uniref:Ldh family oxidoreductase n=1 Tax=Exilibacterium tricleocarpae TaxID=2591008 RepID=A0A545SRX4_9GAMM|nr:Ldh family oxidoreductase [Exilibacterium tricleocarpae]TQV67728.1 Ldh family oxidoreductase [Exilibacterium tricleocarpae]
MTDAVNLTLPEAQALAYRTLLANNTAAASARATAAALVAAEADGQKGHGLSRIPSYVAQTRTGKVDGHAVARVEKVAAAAVRIDAGLGFAYPAIDLAIEELAALAPTTGVAMAAVHRSHHFGQAGAHAERLAERGLVAMVYGNAPKAMAFWGGTTPMLGTNPVAFAAPTGVGEPLVIDLALSKVARGKVMAAQKAGTDIPPDWALDADGNPTTDPTAAMAGSMLPIGAAKGAALVMMVEILAAALTGSHFGFEASSLFDGDGDPPDLGQVVLAIDPAISSNGRFLERMSTFMAALESEPGVRAPGSSRLQNRAAAARDGVFIPAPLHQEITALCPAD